MASKSNPAIVSFSGGEVDAYTLARVDLSLHASTAETLENVFLTSRGAMELAPGTIFVCETPGSGVALVRPWAFSLDSAFCLEISENLLRFISGDSLVVLEGAAATPGTFSDQSSTTPSGGGSAPDGGGGSGNPPPDGSGDWVWVEYGEGGGGYWLYIGGGEVP